MRELSSDVRAARVPDLGSFRSTQIAHIKRNMLNNKPLGFVANEKYLGNTLDVCDNQDISVKRGINIDKINGVLQQLNFAHSCTKCLWC